MECGAMDSIAFNTDRPAQARHECLDPPQAEIQVCWDGWCLARNNLIRKYGHGSGERMPGPLSLTVISTQSPSVEPPIIILPVHP